MKKTKILIPTYNDWKSLFKLVENIGIQVKGWDAEISILIVNDGSSDLRPFVNLNLKSFKSVHVLNMKKNQGHARCIATGLKYINEKENFDYIIPMDGDGEDRPEELGTLLCEAYENSSKVVTANRIERSEGIFFKLCYLAHKIITYTFTGETIKYGNYTCLPKSIVEKMINENATWSSFSGSLAKIEKHRAEVPSKRGNRYFGPSKMSFKNLILHSLSIISVFKKNVLIRSLIFLIVYMFLIQQNITAITVIPVILIFALIASVFTISKRENLDELNNSLSNILSVDKIV